MVRGSYRTAEDEVHEDDRTTRDLLVALAKDYWRCYEQIMLRLDEGERDQHDRIFADYEFDARQFIRSAFAYIEGATFVLKVEASFNSDEKGHKLTPEQQHFVSEVDFALKNGEVVTRKAKIPLEENIRFAFAVFAQANGVENNLDVSQNWWAKLHEAMKVRDRLMHPRHPSHLDVSPQEVIATVKAVHGFDEALKEIIRRATSEPSVQDDITDKT